MQPDSGEWDGARPFVGRSKPLLALGREFDAARGGRPRLVLVGGDTGVGKTRLVTEFLHEFANGQAWTLRGGCIPLEGELLPYSPVLEAVRNFGGARLSAEEAMPESVLAELATSLAVVSPRNSSADGAGTLREFVRAAELLEQLCERRPLVLVIEDLHWSDRSTRALLAFLSRTARPRRMLLVVTYRDDELTACDPVRVWLSELELLGARRLMLSALDSEAASELTRAAQGTEVAASTVEHVVQRSGGNPLFVEQLCASGSGCGEVPGSLAEILLRRIEAVAAAARTVLELLAVAGGQIGHELLAAASELDAETLRGQLRAAADAHLLFSGSTASCYRFRHPLLGEVLYADMLPGEREAVHRMLGRSLRDRPWLSQQSGAGIRAEIAYHLRAGQSWQEALPAMMEAGLAAEAVPAVAEARQHFEGAQQLWDCVPAVSSMPLSLDYAALCEHAAAMAYLDGDAAGAAAHARLALAEIDSVTEPTRVGLLHERLGCYLWAGGCSEELTLWCYRRAVELVPEVPTGERAQVLASLGQALMRASRFAESAQHCYEAIDVAETAGCARVRAHALTTLGIDEMFTGAADRGVRSLRSAMPLAETYGTYEDLGRVHNNLCVALAMSGRLTEAADVARDGVDVARRHGLAASHGNILASNAVHVLFQLGLWEEVDRKLGEAFNGPGSAGPLAAMSLVEARLCTARGDFAAADACFERVEALLGEGGDNWLRGQLCLARAELACWREEHVQAREYGWQTIGLESPELPGDERSAYAAATLLRAEADRRQKLRVQGAKYGEKDRIALTRAIELLERLQSQWADLVEFKAYMANARAELTRAHAQSDPRSWRSAAHRWQEQGRVYDLAYARWREAGALLQHQPPSRLRATRCLAEALEIADRLQALPLREQICALAADANLELDTPPSLGGAERGPAPALAALTVRQRQVLAQLADGATNRQIAAALFLSERTVNVHVSSIFSKLGVTNRTQASAIANQSSLLGSSSLGGHRGVSR